MVKKNMFYAGCPNAPFGTTTASEKATHTLRWYVEPLSAARTKLEETCSAAWVILPNQPSEIYQACVGKGNFAELKEQAAGADPAVSV